MKFLAIDGNSILNRAYYGIKSLSTKDGTPTNAVYGFLMILLRMQKDVQPDYIAVAFDMKAPTFRHEQYDGYKANRKGMPDDLAEQLPIIQDVLRKLGIAIVESPGYEADDILGTIAKKCEEASVECVIATGDRDSLQLINENTTVRLATNREPVIYDETKIKLDYGVSPKELIEVKALMGDSSDNIPGVKGIGEKSALMLISQYHSLEYIYSHLDTLDVKPRLINLLTAEGAKESAILSRELGTVYQDVPMDLTIEKYKPAQPRTNELLKLFNKLEMHSMPEKFHLGETIEEPPIKAKKQSVNVMENPDIAGVQAKVQACDFIDFLVTYNEDEISSLSIALQGEIVHYNFNAQEAFRQLVAESPLPKRTHSAKALYRTLLKQGIRLENVVFDLKLGAYLLDANAKRYDMDSLHEAYGEDLQYDVQPKYVHICVFPSLCGRVSRQVAKKGMQSLLEEIELPLSLVLADMEVTGIAVDRQGILDFGARLDDRIARLRANIFALAGEEFNPNSTKELGRILFEKLQLPVGKKTKTGYSTDSDTLEMLKERHPIIEDLIEYRQLTKLTSTYVTGLLKVIEEDGRIHSLFRQTETRTGRISSTEPNLQNIPIRTDLGREMRRFFVAKEGYILLDADYSQIELRILAAIADDKNMIEAFKNNADIHAITASQVFHVPLEELPHQLRNNAKAINFGIVYGIGPFSLSKDINVSVAEAKSYIEKYLETYSGVRDYMDRIKKESYENGYVETLFHRRRDLPELKQKNKNTVAFGERVARNTPIQGSAADIIKIAMVKVYQKLLEEKLDAKLILQVHDELIIEVREDQADRAAAILQKEMESAVTLSVPLVAEVSRGKTWYDTKE